MSELRVARVQGLTAWVDSRELIGGNKLTPEIEQAIKEARQFIVVLSTESIFALVLQAIQQGATSDAEQYLNELSRGEIPDWFKALIAGLHAILNGDRDPALAADPNLDFWSAADYNCCWKNWRRRELIEHGIARG